jgi:lysophospholipase L1-like esterase
MRRLLSALLVCLATAVYGESGWTGTWATAPEFTGRGDMPQHCSLTGNTVRETVHVSIGGQVLRLWLSNEFSKETTEIESVYIADVADSTGIVKKTARYLSFDKKRSVTLAPGAAVASDAVKYDLKPLQRLSVTITYGKTPENMTSHRGSRTTSYIVKGSLKPGAQVVPLERLEHWYSIAAIDVLGEGNDAVAVIGNSITDGRCSTNNTQDRWTDFCAERLQALGCTKTGVLNLGIGGNAVFYGGGQPAVKRFERDILQQRGITKVIIFEGVNDIGGSRGDAEARAAKLIECYKEMAGQAHAKGLKVYGATITPFGRSFYDMGFFREAARQTVNAWIRKADCFDGVLDYDAVLRDNDHPSAMQEQYQCDWLHPNPEGYKAIGYYTAEKLAK